MSSSSELRLICPPSQVKAVNQAWLPSGKTRRWKQRRPLSLWDWDPSLSSLEMQMSRRLVRSLGFHFYTSSTLQPLASPSIRALVLSSRVDGNGSAAADWLLPSQGPFGPVFLALHMCVNAPVQLSPRLAVVLFGHIASVYVQTASAGYLFYLLLLLGNHHISWR